MRFEGMGLSDPTIRQWDPDGGSGLTGPGWAQESAS